MKYKVTLNGRTYEVEVEAGEAMLVDEYEAYAPTPTPAAAPPAPAAAPSAPAPSAESLLEGEVVRAPMPGSVMKVVVNVGQTVLVGDVLVILEAMKMENDVVATKRGKIAQIIAAPGDTVETGAPLVVIS